MNAVPEPLPGQRSILLVEDDHDLRGAVADILRDAGRGVVEAENGEVALAKLASLDRPCLILLDLRMPGMDGFEFLRQLKERPDAPEFPVIILSAHASVEAAEHYPGVLGTLRKPFDVGALLAWVNERC